ncbi:MAG: DNA-binding response regulator, partial [Bacteroidales bacterium]|nr:DNA-binding response regulator [Bacteroidales bacterium]MBR3405631.1 DNA-binding response regulator [Bacteroidales bacterium]
QIADALNLSGETIRWYRKRLLEKFDVSNSPELVSRAKEAGLI